MMKKLAALLLSLALVCSAVTALATVAAQMQSGSVWLDMTAGTGVTAAAEGNPMEDMTWYNNNTVGVLGLSLRDDLGLTDKWYNVVPVDLTVEGTQKIPLIASNVFYFGSAEVTVADGSVTVTCAMPDGYVYPQAECLQWFTSLDDITADFLSNPVGEYAFDEPVSISEDLKVTQVALLFICNHVNYRQPITDKGAMLTRYYDTQERWQNWRASLNGLMEILNSPENVATATDLEDAATETDIDSVATATDMEDAATGTDLSVEAEAGEEAE